MTLSPRASRQRPEGPGLFRNDLEPELFRGGAECIGVGGIVLARPDDEQHARPAPEQEELRQRVGEHRAARRDMKQIGPAIGAAQPVVEGRRVEHQRALRAQGVGELNEVGRRQIGDEQADAFRGELARRLDGRIAGLDQRLGHVKTLAGESPGRVVFRERQRDALQAFVLRHGVEIVERRRRLRICNIADVDLEFFLRSRRLRPCRRKGKKRKRPPK